MKPPFFYIVLPFIILITCIAIIMAGGRQLTYQPILNYSMTKPTTMKMLLYQWWLAVNIHSNINRALYKGGKKWPLTKVLRFYTL